LLVNEPEAATGHPDKKIWKIPASTKALYADKRRSEVRRRATDSKLVLRETNRLFLVRMPATPEFKFEILDPVVHRRDEFSCESPELTEFLRTRARKEAKARASACFVLVPVAHPGHVAGFYTLSATTIELEKLPP